MFDEKLKSKGQSDAQRQQVRRSIAIYYRTIGVIKSPQATSGNSSARNPSPLVVSDTPNQASSKQADLPHAIPLSAVATEPQKLTGSNWEAIYEQLKNAIKVRLGDAALN